MLDNTHSKIRQKKKPTKDCMLCHKERAQVVPVRMGSLHVHIMQRLWNGLDTMSFVRSVMSSCWHRSFTQITVVWQTKALLLPSCFALVGRSQSQQKQQQSLDSSLFPGMRIVKMTLAQFTDNSFQYPPRAPGSFFLGPHNLKTEDVVWLMSFNKLQLPSF